MADAPDSTFGLPVTPGDRLVLVLLWRHASSSDASPVVWPSGSRLAVLTGFTDRAVRRSLAHLVAAGAIERCRRPPTALAKGKAWRLHPDPSVPLNSRSPDPSVLTNRTSRSPGPMGPPDQSVPPERDPSVLTDRTEGSPRSIIEPTIEAEDESEAPDPRLAMAAAIDAQSEQYQAARTPVPPMHGFASTSEHAVLSERFDSALGQCFPGSPERARLAAARLSTPSEPVLRRACEDLGGVEQVATVFEWAWAEYASGRLKVGRADDAGAALRDAFRGEGRWWRGIVEAHTRRPRAAVPGREWQPPPPREELSSETLALVDNALDALKPRVLHNTEEWTS